MTKSLSKETIQGIRVSTRMRAFMEQLGEDLGIQSYILFGGTPLDSYLNPKTPLHDVDIAIHGIEGAPRVRANLQARNYRLVEASRNYFINITDQVLIVLARKNGLLLDINFLDNYSSIGQFDLETLKCSFPQMVYDDRHGALSALAARTARPIRRLDLENPYLILTRLLVLSAKYDLKLAGNPVHQRCIDQLNGLIRDWHFGNSYHDEEAPVGHYSSVLRSILRASDRRSFMLDLAASRALQQTIPEMHALLCKSEVVRSLQVIRAVSKLDLVEALQEALDPGERDSFLARLRKLRLRRWEHDDLLVGAQANMNFGNDETTT